MKEIDELEKKINEVTDRWANNVLEELYGLLRVIPLPSWNSFCAEISEATGITSDKVNREMCRIVGRIYK